MLLESIVNITKEGAEKPFFFWSKLYEKERGISSDLKTVQQSMSKETQAHQNLSNIITLLEQKEPNEFDLAKAFSNIADTLVSHVPSNQKTFVDDFQKSVRDFYTRSQTSEMFRRQREMVRQTLSNQEQKEYDQRLFKNEGTTYVLEFYLALYKAIQDAPNEEEKRRYIEQTEIDLGFGGTPGLWADMKQDEVLQKFVEKILDDNMRERLIKAYFSAKLVCLKIKVHCDKQGACTTHYEGVTLNEVIEAFKEFIEVLLSAFQEMGIEELTSAFFKPYGDKPKLKDIRL